MSARRKNPEKQPDPGRSAWWPLGEEALATLTRRHRRFGWWSLLVFLSLGIGLEVLHGLKVDWYLNLAHTTRRHMWTLAHAHGTLLAVLNLILGATLPQRALWRPRSRNLASACLLSAGALLPAGFFLGGLRPYQGDPGWGIVLVPIGGLLLLMAVLLIAKAE